MPHDRILVLASGSPRRRVLLRRAGFHFEVVRPAIPEEREPDEPAPAMVQRLAVAKAGHVASGQASGVLVLGADTSVVLDGEPLGKPRDGVDATEMLLRLGGREHRIVTGYCLWEAGAASLESGFAETEVAFRPISRDEAESYVATGEPLGKAGAYAIQGFGRTLVSEIRGSFTNVMGLPMEVITDLLDRHRVPRSNDAE